MSGVAEADFLLEQRGTGRELGAWVVGAAFGREGRSAGFALSDGTVHLAATADHAAAWTRIEAHDGAALSLAPDVAQGLLSGGDDGALLRIAPDGATERVAGFGAMKWVDHVTTHPSGLRAAAVGKNLHLLDGAGAALKTLGPHPSTVGGIAFDAKGKRVFASHYNGVSAWFVAAKEAKPRVLEWKGSHHAIAVAPDGQAVVTAMQENALHGWRLSDSQHMRMSGYPAKTASIAFTAKGRWLASSGADSVVLWPFFGGGPMGKAPTEIAGGDGVICTRVACHPQHEVVVAGFADGLVLMAEIASGKVVPVAAPGRGPVSALAWNAAGTQLVFGTETGFAGLLDLAKR
ncbi:WD40 repeat domain-containing protein [Roseomonas nepalensis]|uniref:WD40 repeat domain-containing protein n=1 Tax=Muricoccus nepalensis TaxID=1854500 RepID=A0A502G8T0_9PROT|nr:WD40 repeat domain-containing protein [Roseomonas nepalensis]TPG58174.1 WD40 repeat domain-containing protein [Roseomonas nepalensis]